MEGTILTIAYDQHMIVGTVNTGSNACFSYTTLLQITQHTVLMSLIITVSGIDHVVLLFLVCNHGSVT